jgi:hypothetical protein
MDPEQRLKLSTPPTSTMLFIGWFMVVWNYPPVLRGMWRVLDRVLDILGFGFNAAFFDDAVRRALYGAA